MMSPIENGTLGSSSSWVMVRRKTLTGALPHDGQEVNPLASFFHFPENAC
jgi:hypothetical protein